MRTTHTGNTPEEEEEEEELGQCDKSWRRVDKAHARPTLFSHVMTMPWPETRREYASGTSALGPLSGWLMQTLICGNTTASRCDKALMVTMDS
jgi:hypothetical protein